MDWLDDFMATHETGPSDGVGSRFINGFHELMRANDLKTLNEILLLPNEKSSKYTLVFFLRTSSIFKYRLSNWFVLRDNAIKWIEYRGGNPERTLTGLLEKEEIE